MHFGTFPMLNGTVEEFENEIAEQKIQTKILKIKIGETVKIE